MLNSRDRKVAKEGTVLNSRSTLFVSIYNEIGRGYVPLEVNLRSWVGVRMGSWTEERARRSDFVGESKGVLSKLTLRGEVARVKP
jgi:hypothetical protein